MFRVISKPNKKISVFRVTGLNILRRVGTNIFFLEKYNFMHFEGISPSKMHKIIYIYIYISFFQKT